MNIPETTRQSLLNSVFSSYDADMDRVLVVDDEPMVREVVTQYLEREGFVVQTAQDGNAALDALRTWRPDLVVLDVMLPQRDGFSVLNEVRKDSTIPVILLTARGEEPDRVVGLELGADD
jgi:two-component system response regulator ResD